MLLNRLFTRYLVAIIFILTLSSQAFASGNGDIAVVGGVNPISISQAEKMIEIPETVLFDINTEEVRRETGYIKGAIFVNENNIESFLPSNKNTVLVFYCLNRLSSASSVVALKAQRLGYKNTFVMLDGIEKWVLSGRIAQKPSIVSWLNSTEVDNYTDAIHNGMMFGVIPACRDCHGSDGIKIEDANSKKTINANCTSCHLSEKAVFDNSSHGEHTKANMGDAKIFDNSKNKEDKDAKEKPSCWSCHSAHKVGDNATLLNRKQLSEATCGKCHEKEQKLFRDTFHGKVLVLESADNKPTVAACYDCHGKHNINKVDNPNSTLFGSVKVDTCEKCHENSNSNFAAYMAHPEPGSKISSVEPTDKLGNAVLYYASIVMITLITCVFVFFGLHTLLWCIRLIMLKISNPEGWKKARHAAHDDKIAVRRFNTIHRIQHLFMALSFLGLSLTGLPQKFYDAPWAKTLVDVIGGPIMATQIHHIAAIVLFAVFVSHIVEVSMVAWKRQDSIRNPETNKLEFRRFLRAFFGPESLMLRGQDFKDMFAHFKWFLNLGPRPQFDRWTYLEKFDYLAEIWGMFVFGITGLILWFPTTFTAFLPGWAINLSALLHSYEALLAIGFIFTVHFFSTHFRSDRFPMDMVIFSGTLTVEELKQERKVWYDRLEKNGKLKELSEENGKFDSYSLVSKIAGFAMLAAGLLLLFLMIYAYIV